MNLLQELKTVSLIDVREARKRAHVAICESKLRFPTKQLAKKYCKRMVSKGGDPRIRPYHCRVCHEFHLTTNRPY